MRSATARGACATCCAGMGHQSDIFALTVDDDLRGDVRPFASRRRGRGDLTIFHFALPSPMTDGFARLPRGRVLQYHNVTPAHFFAPYDAGDLPARRRSGARSSQTLVGQHRRWRLATPSTTARSSKALGFTNTGVFPIAIDPDRDPQAPPAARARAGALATG